MLPVHPYCRKCKVPLQLDEMHYYADEDGTATCNKCEGEWMEAMANWTTGDMPERP